MKILKFVFAIAVSAASMFAQSKLDLRQLDCKATSLSNAKVLALVPVSAGNAMVMCVDLDPAAFKLDTSVSPPVLRLQPQAVPAGPVFVDHELPAGSANGTNLVFTLAAAPNPVSSLWLHRNGLLQRQGVDFTISGPIITYLSAATPQNGDLLDASYRK